jgi:hypothetical protein
MPLRLSFDLINEIFFGSTGFRTLKLKNFLRRTGLSLGVGSKSLIPICT